VVEQKKNPHPKLVCKALHPRVLEVKTPFYVHFHKPEKVVSEKSINLTAKKIIVLMRRVKMLGTCFLLIFFKHEINTFQHIL
jgi:hypothetical protein